MSLISRKPKLGQNFLTNRAAQQRIVDALGSDVAATVVEIGPGHGAITDLLAPRCQRLVAVELDPELAAELRQRFEHQSQVEVLESDILKVDLAYIIGPGGPADAIGNLPYYITSEILLRLFAAARRGLLRRAVLMMQREVAERLSAQPGRREYGLLSATAQLHGSVTELFTLGPDAFSPPPEVHSTVVRIAFAPRFVELGVDPVGFDAFLKRCFAQKRKTLRNNLRVAGYTEAEIVSAWPVPLEPQVRAEAAGLESLAAIYRRLPYEQEGVPR